MGIITYGRPYCHLNLSIKHLSIELIIESIPRKSTHGSLEIGVGQPGGCEPRTCPSRDRVRSAGDQRGHDRPDGHRQVGGLRAPGVPVPSGRGRRKDRLAVRITRELREAAAAAEG